MKVDNSFVTLPDLPGVGFEGKADLFVRRHTPWAIAFTYSATSRGRVTVRVNKRLHLFIFSTMAKM